jgi:WD40 repeat protein
MRLLPIFFLMFSCLAWGGALPKHTADTDHTGGGNNSGVFYWKANLSKGDQNQHTWKHDGKVFSVAFSPDGKQVLTGSQDGTAVLRDVQSGKILQTWKHDGSVLRVAFSPDGKQVLTSSADHTAVLRDMQSGKILQIWKHDGRVGSIAFSPDGKQVLTGSFDNTAVLRDVQSGKTLQSWKHNFEVASLAFSPDGKQVLTGSDDLTAVLRDVQSGKTLQSWKHRFAVTSVAFSPDGKQVLTGSIDDTAVLRDVQSGKTLQTWKHDNYVWSVAFSPDGKQVLTGSQDGTAVLRDVQSGKILQTWKHDRSVSSVAFSPDGKQVLSGSFDNTAVLRNIESRSDLHTGLVVELGEVEADHKSLPAPIAGRKSVLESGRPVKDEFESVAQFNQRVAKWNTAVEKLNADIQTYYAKLGPLPLDKRAQAFEKALSRAYGNPELHDIRYDPETARFFATLKASVDPEFKRLVSIVVPNDQARVAKDKLTSAENGLEVELRVTDHNELIWGQPRVRLNGKIVVADYVDKDFVTPVTTAIVSDPQLKIILPPPIATLRQSPDVKVIDDPNLNKLQMEVLQKEREHASNAARQAEEKRLRERLAELNRQTKPDFEDDLPKLLAKAPASKANPKLHVLAIGINDYADVPDVPFADRSAQQFAEIAKKLLGAEPQNVIVLADSQATLGRLLGRLNTLLNRLGPEDQLIFYYAGHGVPAKDGSGAFLLAQDGGSGSYEQLPLQLGHLYKAIAKSKVGQAKIFIDACFSGRSGKDTIVFEGIAPVVPKVDQSFPDSQRLAVVTAGRGDQFSNQDKVRGHRLFSYHLMRLMLEEGPKLEIAQLHKRLRDVVLNESRRIGPEFEQEPDLQGNGRMVVFGTN